MDWRVPTTPATASALRSRLADIDATIAGFETQLALLRAERELVSENLSCILYPILNLPPEMTAEIFLRYVDTASKGSRKGNLIHNPLPLASVCRAWRAVATSTCALWARININTTLLRDAENLLASWIPRSGNLPLDLDITLPGIESPARDGILRIFAQCSSQWMNLHLQSYAPILFPADGIRGPLTALKKLRIEIISDPGRICMTAFLEAPELREIAITGLSVAQISLPWNRLTRLELDCQSLSQCLGIIEETPELETLSVSVDGLDSQTQTPAGVPRRTLSHLHNLDLSDEQSIELLPHLKLPKLECLAIHSLSRGSVGLVNELVLGSRCTLLAFHLANTEFEATYDCLSSNCLASIRELTLKAPKFHTQNFDVLFTWIASAMLPSLEALNIEDCRQIKLHALTRMLTTRWYGDGGKRIRSLSLSVDYNGPDSAIEADISRLRDLRREGLNVEIRCAQNWITPEVNSQMADEIMGRLPFEPVIAKQLNPNFQFGFI
ncbi:hypothetical protein C8F04DRAFT_1115514 [Mycena alexandri]|uniref:F-box domain-containing protein n=1 Tax=Mycena alexandri TaxID=1745969 RepID=A0AAD6SP01_9AGAR|nr:hypothetical protein C8F04DRAFT_1115514 [Mycena alexandri]